MDFLANAIVLIIIVVVVVYLLVSAPTSERHHWGAGPEGHWTYLVCTKCGIDMSIENRNDKCVGSMPNG